MNNTFPAELDGQMAKMIVQALREKAVKASGLERDMHYLLAYKIEKARRDFHEETFAIMKELYGIQQVAATEEAVR